MNTDEAIKQLQEFIDCYENEEIRESIKLHYGNLKHVEKDYIATKKILQDYNNLVKEVTNLAVESIQRDIKCAKLEAEIKYLKENYKGANNNDK
jgi:hypothetical protein